MITEDEIVAAVDKSQIYVTDGLYLFGVKEEIRYLLRISIIKFKFINFAFTVRLHLKKDEFSLKYEADDIRTTASTFIR